MATKVKDITETGPKALRGVRNPDLYTSKDNPLSLGISDIERKALQDEAARAIYRNYNTAHGHIGYEELSNPILYNPENVSPESGLSNYGDSAYDSGILYNPTPDDIQNQRAYSQPWYAKIGAGLAKGAILAGTTFLDGTVGLVLGAGTAIGEGRWSGLWDNDFSKAMQSVNEWSEEALPNYYSTEEQEQPWYENIFTANFLGDKFIKNLGFTVGAFYSGGLEAAGIKGLGKLAMVGAKRLGAGIKTLKGISKASSIVATGLGSVTSAVNEGRIEALNNSKDWFELHKAQLDDEYNQRLQSIKNTYEGTEMYDQLVRAEQSAYNQALGKLNEDRLKMGNVDLLMNIPILTASNIIQFGKLYANGFKTSRKAYNLLGRPGEYKAGTTKLGAAYNITKGALSEGAEEITQGMASRISGNYYSTDVNNFYKSKTNPEAAQETLDWTKSFAEGINETVNDGSAWEEFFIGSLTGALGMPRFRGIRSESGSLQSPITIEGGAINEWRDYRNKIARENEIANYMNSRMNSPEFKNYYQGLIRHNKYQNDMNQAAEEGDEFNFKNAEHAQLVSDIVMFDQAGKIEDLKSAINEASGTSQEDLESIVVNTTSKDENGNLIGPFSQYASKDDNGNIIANFGTEEAMNEMASKINKNKEDILNTIKNYQDIKDELILKTGQQLSDEQLEELTWMRSQLDNWSDRSVEMSKDIRDYIGKISGYLNTALRYNTELRNREGVSNKERTELYDRLNKNVLNIQHNLSILDGARSLSDEELASVLRTKPEFVDDLINEIDSIDPSISGNVITEDSKEEIKSKLNDIKRLGNAYKTYSDTLREYLRNPNKQIEDHEKIDTQSEIEAKNNQIGNMSTPEVVESIEKGDLDFSDMDLDFDQSDLDILSGNKNDATEEEINSTSRKAKIKNAKDIVNIKERAKNKAKVLSKDSDQYDEIISILDEASKVSDTPEELLDLETEIFNDPSFLATTKEEEDMAKDLQDNGYSPEDIEEAILESKTKRNDEIKGILQQIKDDINKENGELESLPSPNDPNNIVLREFGDIKSADPTESASVVNKNNSKNSKKEEEEPLTPNISNASIVGTGTSSSVDNPSELKGYWKSNTSELPIHRNQDNNDPYYVTVKDPKKKALYKAIYEFLEKNGVFNRIKNNEIKRGQRVRFAFSKQLNNSIVGAIKEEVPVLLIIDDNNSIIGDLSNPYDTNIFNTFDGLRDLYNKAINFAKGHSNDNMDDLIIIPNAESTISKIYIGRPKFTPAKEGNKVFNSLNTIAGDREFKLSLALTSSPNPVMIMEHGRRKSQGLTKEELSIILPNSAKAGQPFLIIETSDDRRKYYPVPIIMPLFSKETRDSDLHKKVNSLISELQDNSILDNPDNLLKWKDKLKELLSISDIYIEQVSDNENPTIKIRIKRLNTDTSWDSVYTGPLNTSNIVESLESVGIPFQVSRKYINSTYDGLSYNNMIGELAKANIEVGELHTVNDFFTLNPVIKGKQEKAKTIKDSDNILKDAVDSRSRKSAINFVEKVIIPNQSKVDRTKTDSDFYYIKEDDGKYHKYERIHRLLPSNFSGTSKYGDRALVIGSAIDKIVRDYFNNGKTEKPEYLSEDAYKSLINYLDTLNKWIKDNNYTIFANNLVIHHKYPDGRRIAGEVDLLIVDNKGNYLIYDIKTSAYSFYSTSFTEVHPQWGQKMSTKSYYSYQTSSYATLVKDEYGKNVVKTALIPFTLTYSKVNPRLVTGLVHEKNIILDFINPNVFFSQAITESGNSAMDDLDAALASLEGKTNSKNLSNILPREEALQRIKETKLFRTPQRKAILSKLEDSTLSDIANTKEAILRAKLSKLDALIKPNMTKEEVNNLVNETLSSTLNRVKDETIEPKSNTVDKEIRKIRSIIPQLTKEDAIVIVNSIIKTPTGYAWGQFKNGIITLYNNAAKGTAYHEAFHYVFNTLLDNNEIGLAYSDARQQWGDLDAISLEERMAEDFREYMQNEETFIGRLKNTWKRLKNIISKIFGKSYYLDNLYYNISKGNYSAIKLPTRSITKNNSVISEEEKNNILRNAKRDTQGRLLAPNGKPSNLTEEQYVQVRTKAFKDWFGDWENNPKEASKVVDENSEPLVVYHESLNVFNVFDTSKKRYNVHEVTGIWASPINRKGRGYGENIYHLFLNLRNPINTSIKQVKNINELRTLENNALKNVNSDGAILDTIDKFGYETQYYVKTPNQVKSAIDNVGTFSRTNDDIRYRELTKEDIQSDVENIVNNPMVNKTRFGKNNSWGKLKDSLLEQGYVIKGYYDKGKAGYRVTSVTRNPSIKQANDIREYHRNKLEYSNLTEEQKEYLKERNIPISRFNNMSLEEKEILFECMS